jgi:OmpA-OmpF porin, OOP family
MTSTTKIVLGALATTALAAYMHGPGGFGTQCAATALPAVAEETATVAAPMNAAVPEAPATAAAVQTCQTDVDGVVKGKTINFTSGGATISADSIPLIDALGKAMANCAGTTVEVAGHTDTHGGDAPNQALSERRANAVVEALVQRDVPTARLLPKGYGETKPLDTAVSAAADARNRRIEFSVSTSAPAAATPAG